MLQLILNDETSVATGDDSSNGDGSIINFLKRITDAKVVDDIVSSPFLFTKPYLVY